MGDRMAQGGKVILYVLMYDNPDRLSNATGADKQRNIVSCRMVEQLSVWQSNISYLNILVCRQWAIIWVVLHFTFIF